MINNLPDDLRRAGVAWVVVEAARVDIRAGHVYAHHWAVMQGLPLTTEEDHDNAVKDARRYVEENRDCVQAFLDFRERERRRG